MLELETPVECDSALSPFLIKLSDQADALPFQDDKYFPQELNTEGDGSIRCKIDGQVLYVVCPDGDSIDGDIILVSPAAQKAQRLVRRNSKHNTFLLTERCDQMCAMCSQPPKDRDYLELLEFYEIAMILADRDVRIGISGGEPTLHKEELFATIEHVGEVRSDLSVHILSNAQHFSTQDIERLSKLHSSLNILWGIPLYASTPCLHDEIVGKVDAFDPLMNNLYLLAATGANIELRTVLTARNVNELPSLAKFITTNLKFISYWAIMAMEPIGYAKANKKELFFDHSVFSQPLTGALDYTAAAGVPTTLFNFPHCTIPEKYRKFCSQSISDWKRKYLDACNGCSAKGVCTGFFEWYTTEWQWEYISKLEGEYQ